MKQVILLTAMLVARGFNVADPDIVGLWESKGSSGNVLGLSLKVDGTFVSYVNKKAFTTGQYTFNNGLFTVVEDAGCTDSAGARIKAVYKPVFFVPDSFRIEIVSDNCDDRRKAVNGSKYGRVKKPG